MKRSLNKSFKLLPRANVTREFKKPSPGCSVMRLIAIFLCLATSSTLLAASETDGRLDSVTLKLKWKHQFQFAGYYAALEKGFYRQEGLDVKIIEAKKGEESTGLVLNGDAEFGTAMSDLVLLRAKGKPVVVLASIFQHSPYIILVPKSTGIQNIHDLSGKHIALEPHSEEIVAYMKHEGIPLSQMVVHTHPYDTSPLINGDIDAMSAYSTDEPFMLLKKDIEYNAFSARSGGIDFYGDTLFTTEQQVLEHPERVSAFLKASIAGWEYALNHPEEIIDLILSKYSRRHSREHLVFEAEMTKRLIMADVVGIGYMNPGRWKHIADTYAELGMVDKDYSLKGFIYNPNSKTDFRQLYTIFAGVILITVPVFLIALRFYKLNQSLKGEIQERHLAENALKKEKDAAQKYLDIADVILVVLNAKGEVTLINRKGCEVLGHDSGEIIGKNWFDHFIPQRRRARIKDNFFKMISGEIETIEFFENSVLAKSGDVRIIDWRNSLVMNDAGQVIGTLSSGTDITEKKEVEAALRKAHDELEMRVRERTAELAKTNEQLRVEIQERKRTESILRETLVRLNEAEKIGNFGYWMQDIKSGEEWWSENEYAVYDQPKNAKPSYDLHLNCVHPDDRAAHDREFKEGWASDREWFSLEYRIVRKDGEVRNILARYRIERDTNGNPLRASGTDEDITDQKHAEEVLAKSREFNRAILMSMKDHIAVLDKAGQIMSVNSSWLEFARENDVSSLELVGEGINYLEVCRRAANDSDETAQQALCGIMAVLDDSQGHFELEYPCHSSSAQRWFLMSVIPFKGEKGGVVIGHTDISLRKKADKELRQAELNYRTVADFTYDWEWWQNPDHTFNYMSPSCERITGYKAEEFLNNPKLIDQIILSEDRNFWSKYNYELREQEQLQEIQFRIRKKDGTICWIEHASQPIKDGKGNFLGFRASNRDITARKQAEEEVRLHRAELAHVTRVATLGELAASLAHEINQPLTAILSNAQAALRFLNNDKPDLEEVRDILTDIVSDDKRAGNVIRRLRTLFRNAELEMTSLDINRLINDTLEIIKSEVIMRKVSIKIESDKTLPPVIGDPIQLQQVILNLVMNASEAMANLEFNSRKVTIALEREDEKNVKIAIQDCGIGIAENKIDRLFEPFYTTKRDGLGMGLSISRSIIETHGGQLWAQNNPDGGATFYLTLPIYEET